MNLSLTKILFFVLVLWSIIYFFFSTKLGTHGSRWRREGVENKSDNSTSSDTKLPTGEEIEKRLDAESRTGHITLKPPPQISTVNYVHTPLQHKDTYKYLSDIEQSLDKFDKIYKSKPPKINPKTIRLSTGLNPYEYAHWQQVLPKVFLKPLKEEKCQLSGPGSGVGTKAIRLKKAINATQCHSASSVPPHLLEFNPYLSASQQIPILSEKNTEGSPNIMQDDIVSRQNDISPSSKSYLGRRNIITINVANNRNRNNGGQQDWQDDTDGRISYIGREPAKGYNSFNQTNDVKWAARNSDNYVGGADTGIERPG